MVQDKRKTESRNPATWNIDSMPTVEMLRLINQEDQKVAQAVATQLPQIGRAVDETAQRLRLGGRLFYCGAGTSGRLGILDASECPPTYNAPAWLVQALIAGGKRRCSTLWRERKMTWVPAGRSFRREALSVMTC